MSCRGEQASSISLAEGYGQSEAGPVLTCNPSDGVRQAGSVGVTLSLTKRQILDVETGIRVQSPGNGGEVRLLGAVPCAARAIRGLCRRTGSRGRARRWPFDHVQEVGADRLDVRDQVGAGRLHLALTCQRNQLRMLVGRPAARCV